jgi:nitrogen regulation protein NR(I)
MSRILVVDDERNVRSGFEEVLGSEGHEVIAAQRAQAALDRIEAEEFDLVILDIRMPGMSGLDALKQLKQGHPKLPVIVMTGQGTMETAVEATKYGAFDYHLKPFEPADMLQTIEKALQCARLMKSHVALGRQDAAASGEAIIGQSAPMQEVYKAIGRVAQTDATVLIRGESGTGKELVARAIYQHSLRSDAPLSVVNCVAIPETLLESELFGYEKGAFTGATARRIGKFEQANGGTVFLDEIGDMPLSIQAKILRVLQEKEFERLGGNHTVGIDVRVLTATNRDLEIAIAEGVFREDLFYRLNVVTIQVPPLRERREDIPALVDYFLERSARELNVDRPPIAEDAVELLKDHTWPGNVRELQHCIQRTMIHTKGHPIQRADLHLTLDDNGRGLVDAANLDDERLLDMVQRWLNSHGGVRACESFLEKAERLLLTEALKRTEGNQTRAAELLGLTRPTLHAKMQKHGLHAKGGPQHH